VSDELLWEKRVTARFEELRNPQVATWQRIQHQRQWFAPWQAGTALFVDAANPIEHNYAKALGFVTSQDVALERLIVKTPLVKGQYHNNGV
jgi:hypothetical protein